MQINHLEQSMTVRHKFCQSLVLTKNEPKKNEPVAYCQKCNCYLRKKDLIEDLEKKENKSSNKNKK